MLLEQPKNYNEEKLQKLCDERCPESSTLDFKRSLPSTSDKDKSEFLKDVCAFANAEGGDLVYGIEEGGSVAKALVPISTELADAAIRRLGQVLDAGLEPRLTGISFNAIPITNGYVLIVRVPSSYDGPHRYLSNNQSKFVMRNGTHTTELTYDQLRTAFDRTATLTESARQFRDKRISMIINKNTWKPLIDGPVCVLHLIPISSMAGRKSVDVRALSSEYVRFMLPSWNGASCTMNLDGLVVHNSYDEKVTGYNQIYRSGTMEAINHGGSRWDNQEKIIYASAVSEFYRSSFSKFIEGSKYLGFTGPALVCAGLLGVEGYKFSAGSQDYFFHKIALADRSNLILPEEWIDSIEDVTDIDVIIRPMLDVLWQAFGIDHCYSYNEHGNWAPK